MYNDTRAMVERLRSLPLREPEPGPANAIALKVARARILESVALDYARSSIGDPDPHRGVRAGRYAVGAARQAEEAWIGVIVAVLS